MAEHMIVGVDFSGNEKSNATGYTEGRLLKGILSIEACERISGSRAAAHKKLEDKLMKVARKDSGAVVAIDVPFAIPREFAIELAKQERKHPPGIMTDVWEIVSTMEYNRFKECRDSFVDRHGDLLRHGDTVFGGPFSPLRSNIPSIWQMTFYGMKMLHRLRQNGFRVRPLPDGKCNGPILLETHPGVLLRNFGFSPKKYKDSNSLKNKKLKSVRCRKLDALPDKSGARLKIAEQFRAKCINDDNCFDSLVAAIGAAKWTMDKSQFVHPRAVISPREEINAARLEGWIYAPKSI